MLKNFFLILLSLLLGVGTGIVVVKLTSPEIPVEDILHSPLSSTKSKIRVIGFLPYWLVDKAQESYKDKITTLTYFGLTIGPDGRILKLLNTTEEEPGWTTFKQDRVKKVLSQAKNEKLETSLLIFTIDEDDILNIINTPAASAQNLMSDIAPIMRKYSFTDLNMDIESFVKASPSSQLKYAEFLAEVKKILSESNLGTLTIDITSESLIKPRLTDTSLLASIADHIVLMGYDYHYIYSLLSGPVAPIGGAGLFREYDLETAVQIALQTVPAQKLILGIPLYGYEWETISDRPVSGIIPRSGKTASSQRISDILASCNNCRKGFEEEARQPYIIIPENNYFRQIFYENEESLSKKLELAQKNKLGGIALWALGYEDKTILNPLKKYKN